MTSSYSGGEAGYIGVATQFVPGAPIGTPTAPTAALVAAAGLVDNGTHLWAATFVSALGETGIGAASNVLTTVTADHGQVNLTAIPTGPSGTTSRKIYRTKAGTVTPYFLVTTLANNTATTYTDNLADASLTTNPPASNGANGAVGTFVAPTQFLMAESDTLDSQPAHIARDVYGGGRDSDQGHRTGKYTTVGQVGLGLYADNGFEVVIAGIGKDVLNTAIASDTTASIVTASGISTLTLVTGTGAYQLGQPVNIDSAGSGIQEKRQVLSWNSGTKVMTVAALRNTHTSSGTTVVGPVNHKVMPYTVSDAAQLLLRFLSVEQNIGGKYSQRYIDCQVGKLNLKGSSSKFELMADIVSNADRVLANGQGGNPAATAFNFSDATWSNLSFEQTDGFAAFPADPTDSGTATLQLVTDMLDWELDINNNMKPQPTFDGQNTIRNFPLKREVTLKFSMLNEAARPAAWSDFVTKNLDVPFFAQTAINTGTATSPVWQFFGIYIPTLRYTKASPIHGLTDIVGEQIEATARRGAGIEKVYLFYENSYAAAA